MNSFCFNKKKVEEEEEIFIKAKRSPFFLEFMTTGIWNHDGKERENRLK